MGQAADALGEPAPLAAYRALRIHSLPRCRGLLTLLIRSLLRVAADDPAMLQRERAEEDVLRRLPGAGPGARGAPFLRPPAMPGPQLAPAEPQLATPAPVRARVYSGWPGGVKLKLNQIKIFR